MYDHLTHMGFSEEEAAACIEVRPMLPGVNPYDTPLWREVPTQTLSVGQHYSLSLLPTLSLLDWVGR